MSVHVGGGLVHDAYWSVHVNRFAGGDGMTSTPFVVVCAYVAIHLHPNQLSSCLSLNDFYLSYWRVDGPIGGVCCGRRAVGDVAGGGLRQNSRRKLQVNGDSTAIIVGVFDVAVVVELPHHHLYGMVVT